MVKYYCNKYMIILRNRIKNKQNIVTQDSENNKINASRKKNFDYNLARNLECLHLFSTSYM